MFIFFIYFVYLSIQFFICTCILLSDLSFSFTRTWFIWLATGNSLMWPRMLSSYVFLRNVNEVFYVHFPAMFSRTQDIPLLLVLHGNELVVFVFPLSLFVCHVFQQSARREGRRLGRDWWRSEGVSWSLSLGRRITALVWSKFAPLQGYGGRVISGRGRGRGKGKRGEAGKGLNTSVH